MVKFILRRVLLGIVTFFGITVLVYLLSTLATGSPLDALLADPGMTAEEVARRAEQLGLDQPVYVQYFQWLKALLQGDLGYSYRTYQKVSTMIAERIGPSLLLTCTAIVLAYLVVIPLGILSAVKPYSARDYCCTGFAFLTAATPSFFIAMLLIFIFSVSLGVLPMGGMYDSGGAHTIGSVLRHLILPASVLALGQIGSTMRYVRGSMLEVLGEDYVRTARAKGLRERLVVVRHAFRNALIPVVTNFGLSIPFLIGGAVVTEQVFSWPGIGNLMVMSISYRDYPTIMGITVIISVAVLVGNILVDLVYGLLDPKIRNQYAESGRKG